MRIAYISSESVPYASTGGLGDVAYSLPAALRRGGLELIKVLPLYRKVWESGIRLSDTGMRFRLPLGFRLYTAEIWRHEAADPPVYFVRRDEYFDRRELYSLPERDYDDNFERFVFFQKAVVALLEVLDFRADIVHCNDWQTALIPLFLRHGLQGLGRSQSERTVVTIHNLAYQGIFPGSEFGLTNLPFSCFGVDGMEFYGQINCLKAGILAADRVITVSPTYADEIRTEAHGYGLDGVLRGIGNRLHGILNGADYAVWNPATDPHLPQPYTPENYEAGKAAAKRALLSRFGAGVENGLPLVGMICRLVDEKGLDLLAEAMPDLMSRPLRLILLGAGMERYHQMTREWARRWPDRFSVTIGFDLALAHLIEAGSDLFLMPSRHEPCGLTQLYALKYGTLPIVHSVGGLKDTICDLSPDGGSGNGFAFEDYTVPALLAAVDRALGLFAQPAVWRIAARRAMAEDHSWGRSAAAYAEVYRQALGAA